MIGVIYKEILHDKNRNINNKLQAHIDTLHINYIATGKNTEIQSNGHGLFGYINNSYNLQELDLLDVNKYVRKNSQLGNRIIKSVISLSEEEAIRLGYTNSKNWENLLNDKIRDIAKLYDINFSNLEWLASFHSKHRSPSCTFDILG